MHSFPLTHAEPPARALVLPTARTLGVLAAVSAIPEYRLGPQKGEHLQRHPAHSRPVAECGKRDFCALAASSSFRSTRLSNELLEHSLDSHTYWPRASESFPISPLIVPLTQPSRPNSGGSLLAAPTRRASRSPTGKRDWRAASKTVRGIARIVGR